MKTLEPSFQNPNHALVPLYSLSHPFEWKNVASHGCEMLEDRVVFKTTHFGYFTVIARFSLPTASITVKPKVSQQAQLMIQELPGFKMEIPSTSVRSKTKITATVHYSDQSLYGNQSNYSPASACVVLEPHNTQFEDRIMITMPIPNYDQIKRDYPNIMLELWHTDNTKIDAPVKLMVADESSIIVNQDGDGNYLATAYITHFSLFTYLWNQTLSSLYWLNFFAQEIRGRCQVFMSHESKRESCIKFGIAVLFHKFDEYHSNIPNHPCVLYDSMVPITVVVGEIDCQIKLDESLLKIYRNSSNERCYSEHCRFPRDFNLRVDFCIRLDTATATVESQLPAGILATLLIKHGSGVHKFNLIKVKINYSSALPGCLFLNILYSHLLET